MACRLVGLSRSAYRRPLKGDTVTDPDRALREWLRAWAKDHPRYGYRRAYHDARAEGWVVNHKKIQRLWRDEGLRVPQRRRRKRVGSSTVDAPTADAPNVVWAVDFQFDADEHGRLIKICSIVDEHTRECIGGLVERSITADRLTAHLEDLVAARGAPGGDEVLEVGGESVGGNRALHEAADAFAGVFVDDRADLDQSSVLVGVELEVHRPHHVRRVRRRRVDGRGPDALASTPLRDPEPFVTPQALDLLVVHHPPLGAGVVIRPPIPVAGMVLRPGAQPLPERPIRVRDRVALERSPVRGAAQPDQTARHPFAHPQLALEVIDGGAAPVRA